MANAPRYWSPAFIEAFVEALNEDPSFQRTAGSFSHTIVLRCFDTPEGEDVEATYVFEDGQVVDVDVWVDDAPCKEMREDAFDRSVALARASAPYRLWVRLDRGETSVMQVLNSGEYVIEGPKLKILTNLGVFNGMNAVAARVEKSY